MANYERQYRPVSTLETSDNDALSVRSIRDIGDAINNYKVYAGRQPLITEMLFPAIPSILASTDEYLVLPPFAPRFFPDGFQNILWYIRHKRTAGSGSTIWKLIVHKMLYRGPEKYSSTFTMGATTDTITTSSDTVTISTSNFYVPWDIRDSSGHIWFLLTAKNSDSSTKSDLSQLHVYPHFTS